MFLRVFKVPKDKKSDRSVKSHNAQCSPNSKLNPILNTTIYFMAKFQLSNLQPGNLLNIERYFKNNSLNDDELTAY